MKLESTRIIDIKEFVPARSIDRLYRDVPYHLVPSGKTGIEGFAVIRTRISAGGQASSTVSCGAAAPEGSRRDARLALTAIAQFHYRHAARAFDGSFLVRM